MDNNRYSFKTKSCTFELSQKTKVQYFLEVIFLICLTLLIKGLVGQMTDLYNYGTVV